MKPEVLIVIIIIIIIIIGLLIFMFVKLRKKSPGKIGDKCTTTSDCAKSLVCDSKDGVCKVEAGGACNQSSDCESSSPGCFGSVCTTEILSLGKQCTPDNPTQPCNTGLTCDNNICKADIGSSCTTLSDCVTTAKSCTAGKCSLTTATTTDMFGIVVPIKGDNYSLVERYKGQLVSEYELPKQPIDISSSNMENTPSTSKSMFLLNEDYGITKIESNSTSQIKSNIRATRLVNFDGVMFALSDGKLYALDSDINKLSWKWKLMDEFPDGISSICVTNNGDYLWIQNNYTYSSYVKGSLYSMRSSRRSSYNNSCKHREKRSCKKCRRSSDNQSQFEVVESTTLSPNTVRVYGNEKSTYLEINTEDATAVLRTATSSKKIENIRDGIVGNKDQVLITKSGDMTEESVDIIARYIGDRLFVIDKFSR